MRVSAKAWDTEGGDTEPASYEFCVQYLSRKVVEQLCDDTLFEQIDGIAGKKSFDFFSTNSELNLEMSESQMVVCPVPETNEDLPSDLFIWIL